jgi:hypothetical protein
MSSRQGLLERPASAGKTSIFLAEISNWTGKVIGALRSRLDQLSKREEVRRTGGLLAGCRQALMHRPSGSKHFGGLFGGQLESPFAISGRPTQLEKSTLKLGVFCRYIALVGRHVEPLPDCLMTFGLPEPSLEAPVQGPLRDELDGRQEIISERVQPAGVQAGLCGFQELARRVRHSRHRANPVALICLDDQAIAGLEDDNEGTVVVRGWQVNVLDVVPSATVAVQRQ